MAEKRSAALAVIVISVLMTFSFFEAHAQSTVDDNALCDTSTFRETARLIREGFQDVKNLQEDLKAACTPNQQQFPSTELSVSEHAVISPLICEYPVLYA